MKSIKSNHYLTVMQQGLDGGNGIIRLPRQNKLGYIKASIIWSWGAGWEHVSVCPANGKVPTWDDMCLIKDLFFKSDEWVVQYHPAADEYVNNMPNCLHLWRPINDKLPTPPSILTGLKGVTFKDMKAAKKKNRVVDCSWR